MKKITVLLISVLFCSLLAANGISISEKPAPVGMWKFEAPAAPAGYASGTVDVSFADNKYAVTMRFSSNDYNYKGEKVKFEIDTMYFSIYVEGQYVAITMKMETAKKMTGKAVYSEGEIQITMVKDVSKK